VYKDELKENKIKTRSRVEKGWEYNVSSIFACATKMSFFIQLVHGESFVALLQKRFPPGSVRSQLFKQH
jgi:hypothetical protein